MNKNKTIRRMTLTAMFSAIAIVLVYFNFPILPQVGFLKYDFADIPILIVTFMFDPLFGLISTVIVSAYQALFLSADGWFGGLMHILGTGALVMPAGLIYKYTRRSGENCSIEKKGRTRAAIGLCIGCVCMTLSMLLFNYLLDPVFYGMPRSAVLTLLPWIGLFNLIKAVVNSVITFAVYKHISRLVNKID